MVEIQLDGQTVEVLEGSTVMHAAEKAGTYIPHFCYHKKLSIAIDNLFALLAVTIGYVYFAVHSKFK
jgi:NADH-quinone oxidoreductase subunit G